MKTLQHLIAVSLVLGAATAHAGGYIVSEVGSRTSGRATAAVGMTDSPAAIIFNPANIALMPGLQLEATVNTLMPRWQHTDPDGNVARTDSKIQVPPALSLSYNLGDMGFGDLAVGLGVYVPYGSSLVWPDEWAGDTDAQELTLQVFEITPVVALRPHKMVAVGFGFRYLPAQVYLKRAVDFAGQARGGVELAGPGSAYAFSAGISVLPVDGLIVGLGWRSRTTLKFEGDANFDFPAPFDTAAVDSDGSAELPAPQIFRFGVGYDVMPDKLNVTLDLEYEMWGSFESLDITFNRPDGDVTTSEARDARNTMVVHVGGEYKLSDDMAVRAGYAYDPYTLPEHTVNAVPPDSTRHLATVGFSYLFGDYGVHAHVGNVFFAARETQSNKPAVRGEWEGGWLGGMSSAIIAGVTFSASLGGEGAPAPMETPMEGGAAPMATTSTSLFGRE